MIKFTKAKSILTKYKTADSWFQIKYSMNLYRGCQHQCIYCDSRSECYGIDNFEDIIIKENGIELLKKELSKLKEINTIGTGAMNDPYMPVEKEHQMTRKALKVIASFGFPVHVITKSNMVGRDIDLLKEIGKVYSTVTVTITTTDDELSKNIEPGAPKSSERLDVIKKLNDNGVRAGIALMPVLPFITDTEENILSIIEKAKECGAQYILPAFGVTLRDRQREYYFSKLEKLFPDIYLKYQEKYKGEYGFDSLSSKYLFRLFEKRCAELNISRKIPAYIAQQKQISIFD
jgi:DNA repair photolyase